MDKPNETPVTRDPICPGCLNAFDADTCWCGSTGCYDETHTFVPYGCTCGFASSVSRRYLRLGSAADGGLLSERAVPTPAGATVVQATATAAWERENGQHS